MGTAHDDGEYALKSVGSGRRRTSKADRANNSKAIGNALGGKIDSGTAGPPDEAPAPVQAREKSVGLNGAIGTGLTKGIGSMPALYIVLVVVAIWVTLGQLRLLPWKDPYPFNYLLFWDNVVQVALCSAILVGQGIIRRGADARSRQTFEGAERIFGQVEALQTELDRQGRVLSHGVSLLDESPNPYIEDRHRSVKPPQAFDKRVGPNDRLAVWLMGGLGSMWAVYLTLGLQVLWVILGTTHVERVDPYPFAFMTFLSTMAQLIFMIIIMVGQDVSERAGDRRSRQVHLDTQATLHELGLVRERLTLQGALMENLADYTAWQLAEQVARAAHLRESSLPSPQWEELAEGERERRRAEARKYGDQLARIGCLIVPLTGTTAAANGAMPRFTFTPEELAELARPQPGVGALSPRQAHAIAEALAGIGFMVQRLDLRSQEGMGKADFTRGEWRIVIQAPMAAGLLVAISEGVVDPEELDALYATVREASVLSPHRFVREVARDCDLQAREPAGSTYFQYLPEARADIRHAVDIIGSKSTDELAHFREFLIQIAGDVADANQEGGVFGFGARYRTGNELKAIAIIEASLAYTPGPD